MAWLDKALTPLAVLLFLYHWLNVFVVVQGSAGHYVTHVAAVTLFSLLSRLAAAGSRSARIVGALAFIGGVIGMLYVRFELDRLERTMGFLTPTDMVMGVLVIGVVLVTTWLIWGPVLPVLAMLFMAYFFFGQRLPGPLGFAGENPEFVMSWLAMGGSAGIFGSMAPVSANYIFLFLVLGGLFVACRVMPMFLEVGKAAGNVARTGPAYTAIIASSLFGTVSGVAVANALFTGTFTIPSMKNRGFKAHQAAAIESAASTGGQITPPIMGAAAFVMASFIGAPYIVIVQKAVVPALLFYAFVALSTYLLCRRINIVVPKERVDIAMILRALPVFVVPLGVLIVLLSLQYSAMYAVAWTIPVLLALSMMQRATRPSLQELLDGVRQGVIQAAHVGVLLGVVGIIAQTIITTGLGAKLSTALLALAGDSLVGILLLGMVISIVLGIGVPTTAAYVLVALVVIPMLVRMGVDLFAAHFFAFWFAVFSTLTPPVAVTSLAASKLAGSHWGATSLEAVRLALAAWLIPFIFIANPALFDFASYTWRELGLLAVLLLTGTALCVVLYRHSWRQLAHRELVPWLGMVLGGFGYILTAQVAGLIVAAACLVIIAAQWLAERRVAVRNAGTAREKPIGDLAS